MMYGDWLVSKGAYNFGLNQGLAGDTFSVLSIDACAKTTQEVKAHSRSSVGYIVPPGRMSAWFS